jgi:hypothetical protein
MKKKPAVKCVFIFVCILLFSFSVGAVQVAPNKAIVYGRVLEYCISSSGLLGISPDQVVYKLTVSVEGTKDIEGSPNFLKNKEGKIETFFSKAKIDPALLNNKIKAEVEFSGDERGGRFWIKDIEIIQDGVNEKK